ncbi:MAG: GNAT family N-acetyltransferase [Planctomycetaceae bacterium]|nr:putative ribosomal N-acetyltransferase YdaF [Planctomycetota bacterium]NUO15029.1 GNAT family N-acetyltransferase [Planctomycetaceae bacterium]
MTPELPRFDTARLRLRMAQPSDAAAIVAFLDEEREFLAPFEPVRPAEYYSEEYWRLQAARLVQEFIDGRSLRLWLFDAQEPLRVLGRANLSRVERGGFHACNLGYALRRSAQGKGLMKEALEPLLAYAFGPMNLHRIEANYMPHNERSGRLLRRLGFREEGLAREYLFINGQWQDHVLTSLTNRRWAASKQE